MSVPKYNKYSAFFDVLNDKKAAFNLEKEQIYDVIEETKNNSFRGKTEFAGTILQAPVEGNIGNSTVTNTANSTVEKVQYAKVRLDDVEDMFVPNPSDIQDPIMRKKIISQHKTAIFAPPNGKFSSILAPGDVVRCNFSISGPNDEGKLRGLTFSDQIIERRLGNFDYPTGSNGVSTESPITTGGSGPAQAKFDSPPSNAKVVQIGDATDVVNPNYSQPRKRKYKGKAGEFEVLNGILKQGMVVRSDASLYGTEILIDCLEDFENLCRAFEAADLTGHRNGPKPKFSGFRSYEGQIKVYEDPSKQYKKKNGKTGHLGAYPGTSNHGWGVAIDVSTRDKNGVTGFNGLVYKWLAENAPKYNFINPSWAQKNGSKPEPWHWEYAKKNKLYKK